METAIQLVACAVEDEEYAIDIEKVQEIIRLQEITRVPHSSLYISGVINLRGMVIPVMDLRKRFGLPEKVYGDTSRIIIINWSNGFAGLLVDGVSEVIRIPKQAVEQPPTYSSNVNADFFTGIGKLGHRLLIMLNLDKIFELTTGV